MTFRCFMSRRGMPKEIFSDNGTNFKGADSELQRLLQTNIILGIRDQFAEIRWTFNPPVTPHMGGACERLVRSVKLGLKTALPDRTPSEDLFRCSLAEIEAMINSRPLTFVVTSDDSLEARTPSHFLLGSSSGIKPFGKFTDEVHVLRNEWQKQQRITDVFWRRWTTEYLPSISQRTRWFDPVKPLEVDDVVALVKSEEPYSWQLGRVQTIYKSPDGNVRQADIQTKTGLYKRPASKIAVLIREQIESNLLRDKSTGGSVKDQK